MRPMRFGMGANKIASGRRPSMEMITTRRVEGRGVGVCVGVDVSVGVAVAVSVAVAVAVNVAVAVCVAVGVNVEVDVEVGGAKGNPARVGTWQASRISNNETQKSALRV